MEIIRNLMGNFKGANLPYLPRFNGGAVGYFGYDLIRYYENLPNMPQDDLELPESYFMFSDEVLVYDHLKQKIHIIVNLHVGGNLQRSYNSAVDRIKAIHREIVETRWKTNGDFNLKLKNNNKEIEFTGNISKAFFCDKVLRAKEYIRNGEIFQVVLSSVYA